MRKITRRTPRRLLAAGLLLSGLGLAVIVPEGTAGAATTPKLYASRNASRSGGSALAGRTLSGKVFIYVARSGRAADAARIGSVAFSLDGVAVRSDPAVPFDLLGGSSSAAVPSDLSQLAKGSHTIEATVTDTTGASRIVRATFRVAAPTSSAPGSSGGGGGGGGQSSSSTTSTSAPTTSTTVGSSSGPLSSVASRAPRFAADSFWYQSIPSTVALHPSSDALVASFDRQWRRYYNNVGINTDRYAPPIYVVDATTPLRPVRFWDCQNKGWTDPAWVAQMAAVPVPVGAQPSAGSDAEMVISQPSTNSVWELWQARWAGDGTLEACWGGRLTNVSGSMGSFAWPFGTTAAGLSLAGGLITPEELAAGHIDHALSIAVVETKRGVHSWPANRNDGWVNDADAIPEGLRFRLDPTIDVDSLNIKPAAKVIAKALQTYGMVVRDTSGSVTFYAENTVAEGRGDPYAALFGAPSYSVLNGIPWTRLQALPMDYGKP